MNHSCDPRKLDWTHARSHRQMDKGEGEGDVGVGGGVCDRFLSSATSQELDLAAVSEIVPIYSETRLFCDSFVFSNPVNKSPCAASWWIEEGGGGANTLFTQWAWQEINQLTSLEEGTKAATDCFN